jgi:hypothetical protein
MMGRLLTQAIVLRGIREEGGDGVMVLGPLAG